MSRILRAFTYAVLLGTFIVSVSSCDKDDDPSNISFGTISGVVTDEAGQPISGVNVTVSGIKEEDVTATTGNDGKYTVPNVSMKLHAVTFSKSGWLAISKSVSATSFNADKVATADASMVSASAKIMGNITDARNGGAPLADVTVSVVGVPGTTTSGADGSYTIENLVAENYTVTFSKPNFVTVTKAVAKADFVNDLVTLNVPMGGRELLRGLTASDLATADKWHYNEYRGGKGPDAYPHWDWACDYMVSLDLRGNWEEQNEGTTLRIRNDGDDRNNPADLNMFDSFVFGSKSITEDNKIMSVRMRTHNADAGAPAYWGVQVIDLSAPEPAVVKIGGDKTYGSGDYSDFDFDLSAYVGKEIIISIGIYRQQTGDYWKQLVLRAIRFADQKVTGTNWLPGTEVVNGWKLTHETVRSTMPHARRTFTGVSEPGGGQGNAQTYYRKWRETGHIAREWSFVPLHKDPEVFPSEGYLIKTRGGTAVNTVEPEAYVYSKFTIAAGSNKLTFRTRNFGSNFTYFKLTAIQDNGTVTHLQPESNTAQEASADADGSWKFKHGNGSGTGDPDEYAAFVYDLSQYNGENVTLVLGVYKGGTDGDENKLCLYRVDLN